MSLLSTDITKKKRLSLKEVKLPAPEPKIKPQETDKSKLMALAQKVIESQNNYSKEEIIARIKEATEVSQERAEKGFFLLLKAGVIDPAPGGRYYLAGSTPF